MCLSDIDFYNYLSPYKCSKKGPLIIVIMPRRSVSRSPSHSPPRRARDPAPAVELGSPARSPPRYRAEPEPEKEPKLFIGSVASEVTEDELRDVFSPHGEIVDIYVCRKETGTFAFVTFSSLEEAEKALQCSGTQIQGQQIKVNFAKPKVKRDGGGGGERRRLSPPRNQSENEKQPKLFVGSLSSQATEDDLRNVFSPHGEIVDLFILRKETGTFAFVTFSSVEEAEKGLQCSGTEIQGQEIRVNFSKPKKNAGQRGGGNSRACFKCQQEGHMARECPNEQNDQNNNQNRGERPERKRGVCFKCQKEGHMARDCPGVEENSNIYPEDKPERPQRTFNSDRPRGCFKCHQEGHMARDCPGTDGQMINEGDQNHQNEKRQDRPRGCFKCHQEGHMARDCPENTDDNFNHGRERRQDNSRENHRGPERRQDMNNEDRKHYFSKYDPFTGDEFRYPSGREDYVNNGQSTSSSEMSRRPNNRFGNDDGEKPFMRKNQDDRPFQRKRSASNSPGSPKKAAKKRSPSRSASPKRGPQPPLSQPVQDIAVKQGFQNSRPEKRSRSRSRSNQRAPIKNISAPAPRKRSASVESY